jgi:transcriptional regulator with XRE-family HTH domain
MQLSLGQTIRRLRKERKLSLGELSKRSGVQLATLSRIENGVMAGTLRSYLRIAGVYDMKLSELFLEAEKDAAATP